MIIEQTLDRLYKMRLLGMAESLKRRLASTEYTSLSFEDNLGLLIEDEWVYRENRKLKSRIQNAKFKYLASVEEIDYRIERKLDKKVILSLLNCEWIRQKQNVIISGPTGVGKTFIAIALGEVGCRNGFSVLYVRAPRMFSELYQGRADGSYIKLLNKMAKVQVLIIDDFGLSPLKDTDRKDLLEIIEERYQCGSTIICSQLPVKSWHAHIGDPTLADAICDRLVHTAHHITLDGDSVRKMKTKISKRKEGE